MTKACFRKSKKGEEAKAILISDIFSEIQTYYPHLSPNMKNKMAIGVTLRSLGFQSTHTRSGNAYFAVFKKEKAA